MGNAIISLRQCIPAPVMQSPSTPKKIQKRFLQFLKETQADEAGGETYLHRPKGGQVRFQSTGSQYSCACHPSPPPSSDPQPAAGGGAQHGHSKNVTRRRRKKQQSSISFTKSKVTKTNKQNKDRCFVFPLMTRTCTTDSSNSSRRSSGRRVTTMPFPWQPALGLKMYALAGGTGREGAIPTSIGCRAPQLQWGEFAFSRHLDRRFCRNGGSGTQMLAKWFQEENYETPHVLRGQNREQSMTMVSKKMFKSCFASARGRAPRCHFIGTEARNGILTNARTNRKRFPPHPSKLSPPECQGPSLLAMLTMTIPWA